jgi:hypothetical protein
VLWTSDSFGSIPIGVPAGYEVNGRQYVVIEANGNNGRGGPVGCATRGEGAGRGQRAAGGGGFGRGGGAQMDPSIPHGMVAFALPDTK